MYIACKHWNLILVHMQQSCATQIGSQAVMPNFYTTVGVLCEKQKSSRVWTWISHPYLKFTACNIYMLHEIIVDLHGLLNMHTPASCLHSAMSLYMHVSCNIRSYMDFGNLFMHVHTMQLHEHHMNIDIIVTCIPKIPIMSKMNPCMHATRGVH